MKAISVDIRIRVVQAFLDGEGSQKDIAERFKVSLSSVKRWVRQERETGSLEPSRSKRGRTPIFASEENATLLQQLVEEVPDATLPEYRQLLIERGQLQVGEATICRALQALKLTRKKNTRGKRTR